MCYSSEDILHISKHETMSCVIVVGKHSQLLAGLEGKSHFQATVHHTII